MMMMMMISALLEGAGPKVTPSRATD